MTNLRLCRRLVVFVVLGVISAPARAAEFRLVGSDLLGLDFSKACYAFAGREGLTLALALDGSRTGLDRLNTGRADLALLTLPPRDEPDAVVFNSVALGWHRLVVIVSAATPLPHINFAQLAAIFGADVPVSYNRWGDLGLVGEWAGRPFAAQAPAAGTDLISEYFRHAVLHDRPFNSQVRRYASPGELAHRLAGDARVIALAPSLPRDAPDLKVLAVAVRAGEPAFAPTPENLRAEVYPLRLAVRIVFRRDATEKLLPLLRFLLSDTAALVVERAEIVSEPASARRQSLRALEKN